MMVSTSEEAEPRPLVKHQHFHADDQNNDDELITTTDTASNNTEPSECKLRYSKCLNGATNGWSSRCSGADTNSGDKIYNNGINEEKDIYLSELSHPLNSFPPEVNGNMSLGMTCCPWCSSSHGAGAGGHSGSRARRRHQQKRWPRRPYDRVLEHGDRSAISDAGGGDCLPARTRHTPTHHAPENNIPAHHNTTHTQADNTTQRGSDHRNKLETRDTVQRVINVGCGNIQVEVVGSDTEFRREETEYRNSRGFEDDKQQINDKPQKKKRKFIIILKGLLNVNKKSKVNNNDKVILKSEIEVNEKSNNSVKEKISDTLNYSKIPDNNRKCDKLKYKDKNNDLKIKSVCD
ncbi:unnamed protein product, partial [Meganyctiphanes norvegica]